jgi:hypothetical protein
VSHRDEPMMLARLSDNRVIVHALRAYELSPSPPSPDAEARSQEYMEARARFSEAARGVPPPSHL